MYQEDPHRSFLHISKVPHLNTQFENNKKNSFIFSDLQKSTKMTGITLATHINQTINL